MTFFYVMFSGIIYLRLSPSNKGYVGQTIDEDGRDWEFGNLNKRYGGAAIEAARRKYPPSLSRVSLCDNGYTPVLPPSQRSISCISLRGKDMGCDSLSGWASRLGISRHSILRVCNGDRNVAGGYVFRYVD